MEKARLWVKECGSAAGQMLFRDRGQAGGGSPSGEGGWGALSWVLASGWEEGMLSCGFMVQANPNRVGHQRNGMEKKAAGSLECGREER